MLALKDGLPPLQDTDMLPKWVRLAAGLLDVAGGAAWEHDDGVLFRLREHELIGWAGDDPVYLCSVCKVETPETNGNWDAVLRFECNVCNGSRRSS
jgi:hypothetical protein